MPKTTLTNIEYLLATAFVKRSVTCTTDQLDASVALSWPCHLM